MPIIATKIPFTQTHFDAPGPVNCCIGIIRYTKIHPCDWRQPTPLVDLATGGSDPAHLPPNNSTQCSLLARRAEIFSPGEKTTLFPLEVNPMRFTSLKLCFAVLAFAVLLLAFPFGATAQWQAGWDGKRHISYQQQKDLFYNYYAQPGPYNGAAAQMYVSPRPVPANVGHTYVTYQPFMPHEYLYKHERSYYTHNPGAGWRRTNVRYGTGCLRCQNIASDIHFPMSNNIWALHNDFYYPGVRF